jgi:hypothetical protein
MAGLVPAIHDLLSRKKDVDARHKAEHDQYLNARRLEQDDLSSNRHPALAFCFSMIFSESRFTLFRIML